MLLTNEVYIRELIEEYIQDNPHVKREQIILHFKLSTDFVEKCICLLFQNKQIKWNDGFIIKNN